MLPADFLSRLEALAGPANLIADPAGCYAYGYDNSRKVFPPQAVAFATSTETVRDIVLLCKQYRIPLVPRGRGTGTTGASVAERGGVVLSLERMRRIVAVDPANRVIVAEPGVLNQEIQDAARPHGFFWPPDPSSAAYCSIGGNLATCAGGPHAVKYGVTRDHVLGLTAVTGKGEIVRTGCYTTKGVVGYDLTRLLIGSEGTLAVVTQATLKLTPLPAAVGGVVAHYRDIGGCAAAIAAIMAQPALPSALEFLDHASLELIRGRHPGLLPAETRALLMIEVDGSATKVAARLRPHRRGVQQRRADPGRSRRRPQSAVGGAQSLVAAIARHRAEENQRGRGGAGVAPAGTARGPGRISAKYRVANANFGHAGNGNIHVNLLVDPDDRDEMQRAEACLDEVFALVLRLGGSLSGEHGVGRESGPSCRAKICNENSLQCDSCDQWWHFRCSQIPEALIKKMVDDPASTFKCPGCLAESRPSQGPWRRVKVLGSLLGDEEDLERRMQLAAVAFRQHFCIWPRRAFISLHRRMRLYNAFVLPVLLYNVGALGMSKCMEEKVDAFHRKQLRYITGNFWPKVIANDKLYRLTGSRPISSIARERRWALFGHVCRLAEDAPARMAMFSFFRAAEFLFRKRGRPVSCLYRTLSLDLERSFDRHRRVLKNMKDLTDLTELARNRIRWARFVEAVCLV